MTGADEPGGRLLEAVSRSFYLTLKALPQGLREPLSLAYLLARAADTMADTPAVAGGVKLELLREFGRLVQVESRDGSGEAALRLRLTRDFVTHQEDVHEAELLQRLPELFGAFRQSSRSQMAAIRAVLDPIVRGQMLDVERFPGDGVLRALATAEELEEYTFMVAGCVGEFWTEICLTDRQGAFSRDVSREQLVDWGIRYGKGLQLVNILRDVGKDARMGRCYLPATELLQRGLRLEEVETDPALLRSVMEPWVHRCREHLECGLHYLDAVKQRRLLFATALPLLMGLRTLALIENADQAGLLAGVKVSRAEVGTIVIGAGAACLRPGGVRRMAEKMTEAVACKARRPAEQ